MKKYIPFFNKASESFRQFGLLTKDYSFSERNEPIEVYALTTLHLAKQYCKAISNLLDEKLYITTMESRNQLQLFHHFCIHIINGNALSLNLEMRQK